MRTGNHFIVLGLVICSLEAIGEPTLALARQASETSQADESRVSAQVGRSSLVYEGVELFGSGSFALRMVLTNTGSEGSITYMTVKTTAALHEFVYQPIKQGRVLREEFKRSCGNGERHLVRLDSNEVAEGFLFLKKRRDEVFRVGVKVRDNGGPERTTWSERLVLSDVLRKPSAFLVAKEPKLHIASIAGNYDEVGRLHAQGVDMDTLDGHGLAALHVAAMLGNALACRKLLSLGAAVDVEGPLDVTPLALSIRQNQVQCVKVLIEHGADVNAKFGSGRRLSPLFEARIVEKDVDDGTVAELLIMAGAH